MWIKAAAADPGSLLSRDPRPNQGISILSALGQWKHFDRSSVRFSMASSNAVGFSRSLVVPLWNARRLTIYCYRTRRSVPKRSDIGENSRVRVGEENGRENTSDRMCSLHCLFSPCPLELLFSLVPLFSLFREWKETPSDATSFLRRIGFIGPNAPFS